MFGVLIGVVSAIGFFKVLRWGRRGYGWRGGGRRRWVMRRLFERLDTTPGQEKVIEAAADNVERAARKVREDFFTSRTDIAGAFRGENFDTAKLDERFAAHQAAVDDVKKAIREGMQSIHEALNPDQRKAVADLIEFGPRGMHGGCGRHQRFNHHHAVSV
jgi:hypothetical protein